MKNKNVQYSRESPFSMALCLNLANPSQNRKRRKKPNKEGYEETAQLPKRARTTTNANDSDRSESEDEEEDPFASSDEDDDPDFDAEKASDDSDSNDEIDNAEEEHDEAEWKLIINWNEMY